MFSNSYYLDLHNNTHVALANLRWTTCMTWIETSYLPLFSYGFRKYKFVDFLTGDLIPPNRVPH